MPRVRLTYQRDIDREGVEYLDVTDERARVLFNQRRAVPAEAEKAEPRKARKGK